ncbi:diacylglycerol/lipid kinase family protein [Kurthia sibirica]|uniref:DAGKc domain-containing protein n=1 Tax=Kurthia sibirica TaxID=202750 RepID=A0A2U3ANZ0_9BACL|nr:diacylglycerol kinase family protein [Kurthia sibirica]PWI26254.1 hypothetical protein DEX24_04835 [Kurthia sibirica]GEK33869.1 diacylglycerol kinase [Kurthia sibirica]
MELVIIINEMAGHGLAKKRGNRLISELTVPFKAEFTTHIGHATAIAQSYSSKNSATLIIVVGGDGTIHEVIKGVIGSEKMIVGVINGGSGNDFGRAFPIFKNAQEIERYVLKNKPFSRKQDIGIVQSTNGAEWFMNNSGFGIDAAVTHSVNQSTVKAQLNRLGLGKLAYAFILLKELKKFKPFDVTVISNGQKYTYRNSYLVVASNQPYFGGGMKISPTSLMDDGLIELTIVHNISKLRLLAVFGTVFFGKHTKFKVVKQHVAEQFQVIVHAAVIGHADGEFIGNAPVDGAIYFKVSKEAWQVATN